MSSWKLIRLKIRIRIFPVNEKVMPLYFCIESPSPTETDSEDELVFNRILEVNKGNASKALLIMGLSLLFLVMMPRDRPLGLLCGLLKPHGISNLSCQY